MLAHDELPTGLGVSREAFDALAAAVGVDVEDRVRRYRGTRALLPVRGRDVLLVDDGLATGVPRSSGEPVETPGSCLTG